MKTLAYIIAVIVIIVLAVVFIAPLFMGGGEKTLGKAKKKTKEGGNKQMPIDFKTPANGGETKLQAVRELIAQRVKQEGALVRANREPDNPRYKELASQFHKEAQKKERFLNINYSQLKGVLK